MHPPSLPPPFWFDAANDVIGAALNNMPLVDFKSWLALRPENFGSSYRFVFDVYSELVSWGVVELIDGRLRLVDLGHLDWFNSALLNGHSHAWKLQELIEKKGRPSKKFDGSQLTELGLLGEKFVVDELKSSLPLEMQSNVLHVSLTDDSAGYDIRAPSLVKDACLSLLEVKTSSRLVSGRFRFFLSRNEFRVGISDSRWSIVGVLMADGVPTLIGHLKAHQLDPMIPYETHESVKWSALEITLERDLLIPGLP